MEEYQTPTIEQIEEAQEDDVDRQKELYDDTDTVPLKEEGGLYALYKWIIARKDSSKIGNLTKQELGMLNISVRDFQRIKLLAYKLRHRGFGDFFGDSGEIVLATSLSKEGFLDKLFVTTEKITVRKKEYPQQQETQVQEKKKRWGLFGKK